MSIYNIILVGLGGSIGSVTRHLLSTFLISFTPWVTVLINISGGFLIGLLFRVTQDFTYAEQIRAFWIIGFCGGFTTFSTFGLDFYQLFRQEHFFSGIVYILVSVFGTIIGVLLGIRCCNFMN